MANTLKQFMIFLIGFFIGIILAVLYHDYTVNQKKIRNIKTYPVVSDRELYENSFRKFNFKRTLIEPDEISFGDQNYFTESKFLYSNISVICVVFIESNSNQDAYHVRNTWGKRCNRLIFFGEKPNHFLEVKRVKDVHSWHYLCEAIKHVWKTYKYELQWVIFSPDHVFVIPENLRYILASKNYMKPYYIGHKVIFWNQVFNSAESGYVLSYRSIELLMDKYGSSCSTTGKYRKNEDYYLGLHLEEMGVRASDAMDDKGRQRFHLFNPAMLLAPGNSYLLTKYSQRSITQQQQGFSHFSPTTISFQTNAKDLAYLYDYLLYNVKLFTAGGKGNNKSAVYTPMDQVWKKFILEEVGNVDPKTISNEDYYKLWSLKVESPKEFNEKLKKQFQSPS